MSEIKEVYVIEWMGPYRQNEEYAMRELTKACLEGTYQKLIKKLGKKDLLILDDFGMHPLTPEARLALLKT